ncbi:MAG: alpha/beta hydrolase [Patescibacteria group bacterium]
MINNNIQSKTIVFVHGLLVNSKTWEHWIKYFEAKGYKCYAPAYPFHEGNPADLRKNFNQNLGKLTFKQVVDSFALFIDKLSEKPIFIGYSMGGLVVQKLIEMNKGVMGVCISSAPPQGIFSFKWSFLKSNFPIINPLKGNSLFLPTVKWVHYACCNLMTIEQTKIIFNNLVIPESRNIPRSIIKKDGKIDFKKQHNPLLFIAGEKDRIIPPSLNWKNFEAYKDKNSKTEFKEFAGRTHYICGEQGWEEVANYISEWIINL